MARFSTIEEGNYPLIEVLARGWGVVARCPACQRSARLTPPQLLERLSHRLEFSAALALQSVCCSECRSKDIRLHYMQMEPPLPRAAGMQSDEPEIIEDTKEQLRSYRAAKAR